nr:dihydrofolate reductase [Tissierella sp.]
MILMLTADKNWNIGLKGQMLVDLEEDLQRFKEKTTGNIIIMGRNTLRAIPGEKSLPGRVNIVMTRDRSFQRDDLVIVNSLDHLFKTLKELNPDGEKEIFVTGGASIVQQLLEYCDRAYITKILKEFPDYDTSIPNLDRDEDWEIVKEDEIISQGDIDYKYVDYRRKK